VRRLSTLFVSLAAVLFLGAGIAQYDIRPFEDDPLSIQAAFGSELAVARLEAAQALIDEGADADDVEEAVEDLDLELVRFAAALAGENDALLEEAREAFTAVEESDYSGEAIQEALTVAREVRDTVSTPRLEDPAVAGAVLSLMLISENGAAEGWEEAAEGEIAAFTVAWALMPRAWEIWDGIKPLANENQVFEIEDQLGELHALFEGPLPPDMAGADPEEGEGAAVHITGFLEDVTGAWLFPDRDLGGLLGNTRDVATEGCAAYGAGDTLRGDARMAWVYFAFDEYLEGTLGLFAPEATEEIDELLGELVPRSADLGDAQAAEACESLVEALTTAGAPFGL